MGLSELRQGIAKVQLYPPLAHFVGPRNEQLISQAEGILCLHFPPTYHEFLSIFGAGSFGSQEFYGVIDESFSALAPDGVGLTLRYRDKWGLPKSHIYIYSVGEGTHFVIDTSNVDSNGECPIVSWVTGLENKTHLEEISPDFGTFFNENIQEAIDWERDN